MQQPFFISFSELYFTTFLSLKNLSICLNISERRLIQNKASFIRIVYNTAYSSFLVVKVGETEQNPFHLSEKGHRIQMIKITLNVFYFLSLLLVRKHLYTYTNRINTEKVAYLLLCLISINKDIHYRFL